MASLRSIAFGLDSNSGALIAMQHIRSRRFAPAESGHYSVHTAPSDGLKPMPTASIHRRTAIDIYDSAGDEGRLVGRQKLDHDSDFVR